MDAIVYDKVGKEAEKVRDALYGIYPQATITDAAIASFDDGADGIPVKDLTVGVEPVQDLHGYDNPWPAGGGKNKLPNNAVTSTIQGVTFTVNSDGTITANGMSTGWTGLLISEFTLAPGDYKIYSLVTTSSSAYYLSLIINGSEIVKTDANTSGVAFTLSEETSITCRLYARPNVALSNVVCYPMILLASETDITYSPYSNICPISGWTGAEIPQRGKNLLDTGSVSSGKGLTITKNSDGSIHIEGTPTGTWVDFSSAYSVNIPAGQYVFSTQSALPCYLYMYAYYKGETNRIDIPIVTGNTSNLVTFEKNVDRINFGLTQLSTSTAYNFTVNLMLERGSTPTSYVPYTGNQISVNWQTEAGTVYGGTLTINPDRTGTLVVDRAMVDLGTLTWTYSSSATHPYFQSNGIASIIKKPVSNNVLANAICSLYINVAANQAYVGNVTNCITVPTSGSIYIYDTSYTDVATFKTAMSGVQLIYELANPVTYQLTSSEISAILTTIYGTNNIWADTGNIKKLTYRADLGKYIDSHITTAVANALNA